MTNFFKQSRHSLRHLLHVTAATVLVLALAAQAHGQDGPDPNAASRQAQGGGYLPRLSGQNFSADTSWHLAGYADATFVFSDLDGESSSEFSRVRFNPAFHFQYQDLILFEAEMEIENTETGTEVVLEYAQANLLVHDNAVIVVGQFLSPVGQFQERLHPSWINRMADMPAGFGHGGAQPGSDTGIMVRGGFNLEPGLFTYSLAIGNGPRVGHEGDLELEAFNSDDNDDKAISGRFGFMPRPNLEFGTSFLTASVTGLEVFDGGGDHVDARAFGKLGNEEEHHELEPGEADLFVWGLDMAFTEGPWDIRVEYLNSVRDPLNTAFEGATEVVAFEELRSTAWYAQMAYRLSGTAEFPALANFEPTIRYGEFEIEGHEELAEHSAEQRLDVGLNYWMSPTLVVRGVVQSREFTARHEGEIDEETRMLLQLSYGF